MECPKCHSKIDDNSTVCPKCRKVILLECPNCHSLGETSICEACGYTILVKCSKCSTINHVEKEECTKWLERGLWHVKRCDELARELGKYKELKLEKRLHTAAIPEGTKIWVIDEDTLMVRPDKYYYGQTEYLHGQKDVWWFTDATKACERCEQVMLQNDELEWSE